MAQRHHTIVTVKGKKGGKSKHGKIRHMTITPSDNGGFTTETYHHPDANDDKSMMQSMDNPVRSVHESPDSMIDHVSQTFGGGDKDEDDDENED